MEKIKKKLWRTYISKRKIISNHTFPHRLHIHTQKKNICFDIPSHCSNIFIESKTWTVSTLRKHDANFWARSFRGIGPILFALSVQFYNQLAVVYEYFMWFFFSHLWQTYGLRTIYCFNTALFSFVLFQTQIKEKVQRFMWIKPI